MEKCSGVVISILLVAGASPAMAGSSDYEVQKHIDRIIEESAGGPIELAIPVAEDRSLDRRLHTASRTAR